MSEALHNIGPSAECPDELHVHIYHDPVWLKHPNFLSKFQDVFVDVHDPTTGLLETFRERVFQEGYVDETEPAS